MLRFHASVTLHELKNVPLSASMEPVINRFVVFGMQQIAVFRMARSIRWRNLWSLAITSIRGLGVKFVSAPTTPLLTFAHWEHDTQSISANLTVLGIFENTTLNLPSEIGFTQAPSFSLLLSFYYFTPCCTVNANITDQHANISRCCRFSFVINSQIVILHI